MLCTTVEDAKLSAGKPGHNQNVPWHDPDIVSSSTYPPASARTASRDERLSEECGDGLDIGEDKVRRHLRNTARRHRHARRQARDRREERRQGERRQERTGQERERLSEECGDRTGRRRGQGDRKEETGGGKDEGRGRRERKRDERLSESVVTGWTSERTR
ncbi:hypothetical protein WMY93_033068 [Mugilogobius chulae]|uniref:Uncharacterized protein n=1 Tax=Mugilogobius chulae TaxID=88201 RepID=A0AAW0MMB1_9GOBI